MRVVSVSGTMDSGKTTLIKALVSLLVQKGKTCSVIVNEKGSQTYDDDFLSKGQISVEHLQGG